MELNEQPQDFKEFFELLNSENVEYLLIGGFAVGMHGHMRFTADIDAWVKPSEENAERVTAALQQFGFRAETIPTARLAKPNYVFQIGVPPIRIDVITSVSGCEFDDTYSRRVSGKLDGTVVQVISLEDLKINKKASGRLKDLADLEELPESPAKP